MSKGLEALCYLDDIAHGRKMSLDPHELKLIVEKELKALEIIKNKIVDCWAFISDISITSEEESLYAFSNKDLTKEEVELLKEVLL